MKKGFFLTFDIVLALLLLFAVIALAAYYFSAPQKSTLSGTLLSQYMQDAATIMSEKGYLSDPFDSVNNSNTSGIRQVLRKTPQSVCMQVSVYGIAVKDGLVAYWKLDETGKNAEDSSGNRNIGRIFGSPYSLLKGKAGGAINFNGSQVINITDSPDLNPENDSFSISLWLNVTSSQNPSTPTIFGKYPQSGFYPGYRIYYDNSSGKPCACFYSSSNDCNDDGTVVSADSSISGAGWKHIVAVFDKSTGNLTMYIDSQNQSSISTGFGSALPINNTNNAWIGADYFNGTFSNGLIGAIDEIRLYSKPLSQSEINELYSNSKNLAYTVNKHNCTYSKGEQQVLKFPFAHNANQDEDIYYYAIIKAWYRGVS